MGAGLERYQRACNETPCIAPGTKRAGQPPKSAPVEGSCTRRSQGEQVAIPSGNDRYKTTQHCNLHPQATIQLSIRKFDLQSMLEAALRNLESLAREAGP